MDDVFMGAAIFGSIIAGILLGLVPLICGLTKKKQGLAIGGFLACIAGSFLLGLFLSVPCCIIFTVLIFVTGKKAAEQIPPRPAQAPPYGSPGAYAPPSYQTPVPPQAAPYGSPEAPASSAFCPKCGNAIEPGAVFCNKCGAKTEL